MPHHKSNFKRMRQSEKQRIRNRAWRSQLRTAVREMRERTETTNVADQYRSMTSLLDRAASRGLIHKRAAARYKSRLAKQISAKPA